MLVLIHGGPNGLVHSRYSGYNQWAQYFASRGWFVYAPNYRGSWMYGRDYRQQLNTNWGIYDVEDVYAGINSWLNVSGLIDRYKIALLGTSAGGYTIYQTLIKYPEQYRAGIIVNGVSDLYLLDKQSHLLERHYNIQLIGPLPKESYEYNKRSPAFHAEEIVDPLYIFTGGKDTVVVGGHTEQIKPLVKGKLLHHDYPNESHVFSKIENWEDFFSQSHYIFK